MPRLHVYGALVGLIFPLSKYLETIFVSRSTLPVTMLVLAGLFLAAGLALFLIFLRTHPTRKEQVR